MTYISKNINSNFFFYLFLFFSFISEYQFINSSLIPYVIALVFTIYEYKKIKLNKSQIFFLLFFIFYILLSLFYSLDIILTLKSIKYWFGFFLIYFYLCLHKNKIDYLFLLRFLCSVVIIESILINTILNQEILYHTPNTAYFFNIYQRPPSFAGISSITGIGLVFLYFYNLIYVGRLKYYDFLIFIISLLLLFSLSSFILFILFFLMTRFFKKKKNYTDYSINFLIILFMIAFFFIINYFENLYLTDEFNFEKITISYFKKIVSSTFLNFYEFFTNLDFSVVSLFGNQTRGTLYTSGDNAYLLLFLQTGLLGLTIFLISIYIFLTKTNLFFLILLLIYISNFHYYIFGNIMVQIIVLSLILYNGKK